MDGELVVNPPPDTFSPTGWDDGGGFDLLYAANEHRALMIEMGGGPVSESLVDAALELAHKHVSREGGGVGGTARGGEGLADRLVGVGQGRFETFVLSGMIAHPSYLCTGGGLCRCGFLCPAGRLLSECRM